MISGTAKHFEVDFEKVYTKAELETIQNKNTSGNR